MNSDIGFFIENYLKKIQIATTYFYELRAE